MGLVATVDRDEVCSQGLDLTCVTQPTGIETTHTWQSSSQRLRQICCLPVIADHEHISVEVGHRQIEQEYGAEMVERPHHLRAREDRRRLLGCRALRHRERIGALLVKAQRIDAINDDLADQLPLDSDKSLAVPIPGNSDDHNVTHCGTVGIGCAGHTQSELGRNSLGTRRVPRPQDDGLTCGRETQGQPAPLLPCPTEDPNYELGDIGHCSRVDTQDFGHGSIIPAGPRFRHDGSMDAEQVAALRELLATTTWVDRTRSFAQTLRRRTTTPSGLLLVGTPEEEPWHLTAHLSDEARISGVPELVPTLVRWHVPKGAPEHLSVTLQRLETARRGETVLVVAEEVAPEGLLERAWDARKLGATILSLDGGDSELQGVAHESLTVVTNDLLGSEISFDTVQHLVSAAAGETGPSGAVPGKGRGFRDRLGHLLDVVSGPTHR